MKKRILGMFPHLTVVISLMILTFFVTDRFNTAMAFINHSMTKRLLVVYLLCYALCLIDLIRREKVRRSLPQICLSILSILLVGGIAILLALDFAFPARLLLTFDLPKVTVALLAVSGIFSAILLIIHQRREVMNPDSLSESDAASDERS